MSSVGTEFLVNWIANNVRAGGQPEDPLLASQLARSCIIDAAAEGITLDELRPDSGSIESHIADAILHRQAPERPGD